MADQKPPLEYGSEKTRRITEFRVMVWTVIPCIINAAVWVTLFTNPRLGFRDDLTLPFVANQIIGPLCACGGLIVGARSKKSVAIWALLVFFLGIVVLNAYGFLWCLGAAVNAIA